MKEVLIDFYELLDRRISHGWKLSDKAHLLSLAEGLGQLCSKVISIGTLHPPEESGESSIEHPSLEQVVIHYDWMREAKAFLVLWRDVVFEYQKGLILHLDGEVTDSGIEYLRDLSEEKVKEAAEYIKGYYGQVMGALSSDKERASYLEAQSLRSNPWPVYKQQMLALEAQSAGLIEQYEQIVKTKKDFDNLEGKINDMMSSFATEIERVKKMADDTKSIVKDNISLDPLKIVKHIEALEQQMLSSYSSGTRSLGIEKITSEMIEETIVPVAIMRRRLMAKEVNIAQVTKSWLDGEIQPIIMESQEILDSIVNSMKMALVNLRNRISLIINDSKDGPQPIFDIDALSQPLNLVTDTINNRISEIKEYQDLVNTRLSSYLKVSHIYRQDGDFLDASQQYILGQLRLDQSAWIQKIKNWMLSRAVSLRNFMADVAQEESLSDSEKIVRFVKSRAVNEENTHYNNIFSSQGYIGESFWVGREKELSRMSQLIANWQSGFRGSVILTGKRFSGKTVFGESIVHRYFLQNTIRLTPQSVLKLKGRTIEINDDLNTALGFIKKNTINEHYLIWIDDLELWQSSKVLASQNVQSLLKHVDDLSSHLFFMVSMSNWFKNHYSQMYKMDKAFHAEINLDHMSEEEILQAITIRHGATHKTLVDEEGAKVLPHIFSKMVHRLNNLAQGNIGQALNSWSYFTEKVDDKRVIHRPALSYQLPDFINDENSILLRTIVMSKRTNEYRLRKSLGASFQSKYKAIVQRLINLGVLIRHMDGMLEINEGVVNDVAAYLHKAKYIKYTRQS